MTQFRIRQGCSGDQAAAYYVCLKTGDHGRDGESFYKDDPDALGRIFVGPYLKFESELSLILEDDLGVCGYALGALDSNQFYKRYEAQWRPQLCAQFPMPQGGSAHWSRTQRVHSWYHHPNYYCPEPYGQYPSHMHIDLLERARGQGLGRRMLERIMAALRARRSPGVHLAVSAQNELALAFYRRLGFHELTTVGNAVDETVYLGKLLADFDGGAFA